MANMSSEQKVYGRGGEGLKGEIDMVGMDHGNTKKRAHPAHRQLGLSHKEWVAEGKPKAHY